MKISDGLKSIAAETKSKNFLPFATLIPKWSKSCGPAPVKLRCGVDAGL